MKKQTLIRAAAFVVGGYFSITTLGASGSYLAAFGAAGVMYCMWLLGRALAMATKKEKP